MSTQMDKRTLVDKVIDIASTLPIEYQEQLLSIAKGMEFTGNSMVRKQDEKQAEKGQDEAVLPPKG